MNKVFEVIEFDVITNNKDYRDSDKYKYLDDNRFNILIEFIENFREEGNGDMFDFMRISSRRNVGKVVSIRNYVGLIQLANNFQIQVLPKINFASEDVGNEKTKKIFLRMIRSMRNFPSKVFSDANLNIKEMNLYEIFINMYLQEVRQLIKRGIKLDYVIKEENQKFLKGKLLTSHHIKKNLVHKERFYVAFDEFHPNRPENRLIKAALLKLLRATMNSKNVKDIKQLLGAFEMVEPSVNFTKDFSRVKIDRTTKEYTILIQWTKVFLMNKSFTTFAGDNLSKSLLFPMEKVFESYVALYIKKIFVAEGWEVKCQDKSYHLFDKPRLLFALKPDIVCKKGNRIVIIDTKWKNLINNEGKNYGIIQPDMYQMYAYSKKYQTSEIWLLYPLNDEMRNHKQIEFSSGTEIKVGVHFVDLANIEESLKGLIGKLD
mgnify:CR=1 FL=1